MVIPSLYECRERFKNYGECQHYYKEWVQPYGCDVKIETCSVCAKTFQKKYPSQNELIKMEISKALDSGEKNKQKIYDMVQEKTDSPRPTIRRVAQSLKVDLQKKVDILSEPHHDRNSREKYTCTACSFPVHRKNTRCPNCKAWLDWSDEE